MQSLIIKNAKIVDGTGGPSFRGEVLITNGEIREIGEEIIMEGCPVLDAEGAVLAPGFVDLHSHSDLMAIRGRVEGKLLQGVTTEIVGNCGFSAAPIPEEKAAIAAEVLSPVLGREEPNSWVEVKSYLDSLEETLPFFNVGTLVGHGTLRLGVMGLASRPSNQKEREQMILALRKALKQGAWGFSSGLIYSPGCYADFAELKELCLVAADFGVPYVTHIRSEADRIIEAVKETLLLGWETGVHVHFSHHQIDGKENWGKAAETLALIGEARAEGIRVTLDQYPYQAGSTMLWALLPQWVQNKEKEEVLKNLNKPEIREKIKQDLEGEEDLLITVTGWDNIMLNSLPKTRELEQNTIKEAAEERKISCSDVFIDLVLENTGSGTVVLFDQCEEDWQRIFADPYCSIATDSILVGEKPHPRSFGSYPRVLGEIVREKRVVSLEKAVNKMTLLPAETFGLKKTGAILPGSRGDLVIFDEKEIGFGGTFKEPDKVPEGIKYVLIEGKIVCQEGEVTGNRPGKVLRRKA